MKNRILSTSFLIFTFSASAQDKIPVIEYQIYSGLIESLFMKPSTKHVVVFEKTIMSGSVRADSIKSSSLLDFIKKFASSDSTEIFRSFIENNQCFSPLNDRQFNLNAEVSLIDRIGLDTVFVNNDINHGWTGFNHQYPDSPGYIMFSRAGYNKNEDKAVVFFVLFCGSWCGEFAYVFLERHGNKWKVVDKYTTGMI
ncbi:hypothetical protein JW948_14710 [bacterium]|nr:hypothetical protein [bacterium]